MDTGAPTKSWMLEVLNVHGKWGRRKGGSELAVRSYDALSPTEREELNGKFMQRSSTQQGPCDL